jgi:hypothetical protein
MGLKSTLAEIEKPNKHSTAVRTDVGFIRIPNKCDLNGMYSECVAVAAFGDHPPKVSQRVERWDGSHNSGKFEM